ncbi:TatD family hydrolase [Candidatus Gottesmanbacteria bacterium]|nr:TatD family hydrolase [Candidatus Gottesmanbacteria bacterium]
MLIDTHCHLNFHAFNKDLDDVVRRAKEAGVEKIIVPGTDLTSSQRAIEVAQTYDSCFATVGIHPHHAQDPNLVIDDNVRHQFKSLLSHDRVVAVGEIGLDYYRYNKTKYTDTAITSEIKQKQKKLLLMQLELAHEHELPVILHCREAHSDLIQTISSFAKATDNKSSSSRRISRIRENSSPIQGVFHCFTGSTHHLSLILTMGYYVGFDGNITYSSNWQTLVSSAPLERILLETDAPFLTPEPHRGTRNEPAYLLLVAKEVAKFHTTSLSKVIHISTMNAGSLFRLR